MRKGPRLSALRSEAPPRDWVLDAAVIAALAMVIGAARFFHAAGFGLYQDDYSRIPALLGAGPGQAAHIIWAHVSQRNGARPLHELLIHLFTFIGLRAGALPGAYALAFAIDTLEAFLFFVVVRRLFADAAIALAAAFAFALFPADTTRIWLTSAFGLQTSVIFFLLAVDCYLRDRRPAAYLLLTLSLLTYELMFPLFFAVPLLGERRGRELWRELRRNGVVLLAALGGFVGLRSLMQERRLADFQARQGIATVLHNLVHGPLVSIGSYVSRPAQAIGDLQTGDLLLLAVCFVTMLAGFAFVLARSGQRPEPWGSGRLLRMTGVGIVVTVLGYALTVDGDVRSLGVGSRVHLAAAFGAGILLACAAAAVWWRARAPLARQLAVIAAAAWLTTVAAANLPVQRDYVASWAEQRRFWTELLRLVPDLDQGDRILLVNQLPSTRFSAVINWEAYSTFGALVRFAPEWRDPPALFVVPEETAARALSSAGPIQLDAAAYPWGRPSELEISPRRSIVLRFAGGQLTRLPGPRAKADPGRPAAPIEAGTLYGQLVRSPDLLLVRAGPAPVTAGQ